MTDSIIHSILNEPILSDDLKHEITNMKDVNDDFIKFISENGYLDVIKITKFDQLYMPIMMEKFIEFRHLDCMMYLIEEYHYVFTDPYMLQYLFKKDPFYNEDKYSYYDDNQNQLLILMYLNIIGYKNNLNILIQAIFSGNIYVIKYLLDMITVNKFQDTDDTEVDFHHRYIFKNNLIDQFKHLDTIKYLDDDIILTDDIDKQLFDNSIQDLNSLYSKYQNLDYEDYQTKFNDLIDDVIYPVSRQETNNIVMMVKKFFDECNTEKIINIQTEYGDNMSIYL